MSEPYTPGDAMEGMFTRARREGLWFYTSYQGLWFSPDVLEREQQSGRFRWDACNWELRDPAERLRQLDETATAATEQARQLREQLTPTNPGETL